MYKKLSHFYKVLKKSPFGNPKMLRWATRLLSLQIDRNLNSGYSFMPYLIHMMPTQMCNLRCKSCGQWGSTGFYNDSLKPRTERALDKDVFKSFIDQVAKFKPTIFLTGGEPLLHKDIVELLRHIKSRGLVCWIVSNGTMFERYAEDIVDIGVDVLYVSIDGPDKNHDEIRGMKNCFEKVERGIKKIKTLKAKHAKIYPKLCQISTISNHSYRYLNVLPEITEQLGLDMLIIKHSYFTLSQAGRQYEEIMAKHFNCNAPSWKGWVRDDFGMDLEYIQKCLTDIQERKNKFLLSFFPHVEVKDIPKYYSKDPELFYPIKTNGALSNGTFNNKNWRCIAPWTHLMIYPNGDAMFCNDNPDYILGNINKESFSQIWNNEKSRKFRQFIKNNTLPICSRCCGLHYHPFFRSGSNFKMLSNSIIDE